jgi:glucose-1-phosphate thymidylyltransferase
LAHAVITARKFLKDDDFLMFLGDNLIEGGVKIFVDEFDASNNDALVLLKEVADARSFGVAELEASGKVINLVEKPTEPKSNLALVGVYLFSMEIHRAVAKIKPSRRGELEITDAVQKLLEGGKTVTSHILKGWWLDTGKKDDILAANRVVLNDYVKRNIKGQVDARSRVVGRVEIGEGATIENSTIRGPSSIAGDCLIRDSHIGPFTSIGKGTHIEHSSLERSVILEKCRISGVDRFVDSIIGRETEIMKCGQGIKTSCFFVGDNAKIIL